MTTSRSTEIWVGTFLAAGLLALFFLAMQVSNLGAWTGGDTYEVKAYFDNIGGLKEKAPVTMAGVEVGRVLSIAYDPQQFRAVATLGIYQEFNQIPKDTFAKILTAGLLGEQYVGLDPGGAETNLAQGDTITMTQSALVLEELIGQLIFNKAQGDSL